MNLDEQRHRYCALNDWFKTPQGHYLGEAFAARFSQFNQHLNQDTLLQLGLCGTNSWLPNTYKKTWLCTPCLDTSHATFIASPEALPLPRNSVDVVVAPMMLEVFGQYKAPWDEIDRVLSPMGHVIFFGINPMSLWGAALACRRLSVLGHAKMMPHSSLLLKRAFSNRGYQQQSFESFYYVPPLQSEKWIQKCFFLNEMGKMMSLFPAGFYCLVMQKYQSSALRSRTRTAREPMFLPG